MKTRDQRLFQVIGHERYLRHSESTSSVDSRYPQRSSALELVAWRLVAAAVVVADKLPRPHKQHRRRLADRWWQLAAWGREWQQRLAVAAER